jgi:hypothetical protein
MINCRYYQEIYYSLHDFETLASLEKSQSVEYSDWIMELKIASEFLKS